MRRWYLLFAAPLLLELLVGYSRFWTGHRSPALFSMFKSQVEQKSGNPFIDRSRAVGDGYHLHPFIDYTGAQTPEKTWDYFGFRNRENLYFSPKPSFLVVLTGGSEAAGYRHHISIAERLEILLQKSHPGAKVLNLAMNSYVLNNEINAYTTLAYHLAPDIVISLSGWNDIVSSLMVPENFKRLGLNYLKQIETWWLPRLYELRDRTSPDPFQWNEKETETIVPAYLQGQDKFSQIVTGNQGRYLPVLQGNNPVLKEKQKAFFSRASQLYLELQEASRKVHHRVLMDSVALSFIDNIHTDDTSAQRTAEYLADAVAQETQAKQRLAYILPK